MFMIKHNLKMCRQPASAGDWKVRLSWKRWMSERLQKMTQHLWFNPRRPRCASDTAACGLSDGVWNLSNSCSWQPPPPTPPPPSRELGGKLQVISSPNLKTQNRWLQAREPVAVGRGQERRWLGAFSLPVAGDECKHFFLLWDKTPEEKLVSPPAATSRFVWSWPSGFTQGRVGSEPGRGSTKTAVVYHT